MFSLQNKAFSKDAMRTLKINLSISDPKTNEILIVSGDLSVLRDFLSGIKISLPYRLEEEAPDLKEFISDTMAQVSLNDVNYRTQSQTLYDAYSEWCGKNGYLPLSSTRMSREWERIGLVKQKVNGLKYWIGIKL